MYDPSMLDPEERRRRLMLSMLMGNTQRQGGGHAGGANQLGSALAAAMLMNPDMMKGFGLGVGNLARGYQWDGMTGGSMLDGLSQQAVNNSKWGGPV